MGRKRKSGEGTVRLRKDGRWEGRVVVGYDDKGLNMKYFCTVISVADINAARKFYEDLFGLEVFQDYGKNVAFTCGLALQQDFDWLVGLSKDNILTKSNNIEICFEEQDFDGF